MALSRSSAGTSSRFTTDDHDLTSEIERLAYRRAPALDADDEEKGLYVASRWAVQDDHYRGLYQLWSKVLFFLVGKHWLKWNESAAMYTQDTEVPPWRQQPVTNLVYAVFRTAVAKLTKNRPTHEVVPPSGDSQDREAAKLAEALLEFLWRYLKTPQKVWRAVGWFVCTGNVYLNADWDPQAGRMVPRMSLVEVPNPDHDPNDLTSDPTMDVPCACDEDGEPLRQDDADESAGDYQPALDGGKPYALDAEPDEMPEGEIEIEVDDPFSVRFNPDAPSPEEADEWFIAKLLPTSKVCDMFDLDTADLQPEKAAAGDSSDMMAEFQNALSRAASAAPDPYEQRLNGLAGSDQSQAIGDRTLVIYYYAKPDPKGGFPRGRHYIVAGTKKVWPAPKDPEHPTGEAELPFGFWPPRVPMVDTPIPGQPQGIGMLTQVMPLNDQLNILDGKILEKHTIDSMGGVWFVCMEDKGLKITTQPGQVRVSKAMTAKGRAAAPFQAELKPLPAAVYAERDVLMSKIRVVGGLSEVDLGQRPEGVTAGRAFLVLQEASEQSIATAGQVLEAALEELGRRELVIAQRMYTESRDIKIRGNKGQWEFRSFKGADLRDGMDVRVQTGSSFPWSKAAQWDTKLSLIESMPSLILKPDGSPDTQKLARYLDDGGAGLSAFESDSDPDSIEFEREIAMFENYDPTDPTKPNELPQLGFWQTIPVKQQLAYTFLKTDRARIARWSPMAQQAFIEWCQAMASAVQDLINSVTPSAPALGSGAPSGAPGGAPSGGARGGAPVPADKVLKLVPGSSAAAQDNVTTARPSINQSHLTRADFRAAGQQ